MGLREDVIIITPTGQLTGHLYVGADHLPELFLPLSGVAEVYRPATLPYAWTLNYVPQESVPVLFAAWKSIERFQGHIAQAEREAEGREV